ncbi:HD domain-containing phosphohydrolase [uncultured Thermanaerothrix sp.]|uniref:HD-GYP domain-containing protein n=1 Tax=uncultured Thermanaerothrix sp. TaxID=1195149 RepID=UPI00261B733B|nr:HD domain-containing phosphohydrolase [uncultured Thermanaerothrix sp.]
MEKEWLDESIAGNASVKEVTTDPAMVEVPQESQSHEASPESAEAPKPETSSTSKSLILRIRDSVRQWLDLQRQIRAYPQRARQRLDDIESAFLAYRVTYASLTFKAPKIEEELLDLYYQISETIPSLEQKNRRIPLFICTNSRLRQIKSAWDDLSARQNLLLEKLATAPKRLDFYNRMQVMREKKRLEEIRRRENAARLESATESVKKVISYVENQCKNDEPILFGNEVLTFQNARSLWEQILNDILQQRNEETTDVEDLLGRLRMLEESVREYPTLSKQVQRIGERFSRLIAYHDLLSSYGKRIIPQAEIVRASAIMYEQIPALWAAGQYQQLKVMLERVENFLNFYENTVELEVAIGERRRPGFTQSLSPTIFPGAAGLSPLINLARVLVAAIDQRDRFMVGHSERVARYAIETAKRMNWSGSDLEFIEIAALLHDVGKISIPEAVLTKVKPLTSQEWKMIQMHPYYGAQIVRQMNAFSRIVPWIYHHQEHWDGTGYPDQLSKQEIPPASAIIAVAEAYTMMTTDLPYRSGFTSEEALNKIREAAGAQFNPEVTEAFIEAIQDSQSQAP